MGKTLEFKQTDIFEAIEIEEMLRDPVAFWTRDYKEEEMSDIEKEPDSVSSGLLDLVVSRKLI